MLEYITEVLYCTHLCAHFCCSSLFLKVFALRVRFHCTVDAFAFTLQSLIQVD